MRRNATTATDLATLPEIVDQGMKYLNNLSNFIGDDLMIVAVEEEVEAMTEITEEEDLEADLAQKTELETQGREDHPLDQDQEDATIVQTPLIERAVMEREEAPVAVPREM